MPAGVPPVPPDDPEPQPVRQRASVKTNPAAKATDRGANRFFLEKKTRAVATENQQPNHKIEKGGYCDFAPATASMVRFAVATVRVSEAGDVLDPEKLPVPGVTVHVISAVGMPVQLTDTVPLKPPLGAMAKLYVAVAPAATVSEAALVVINENPLLVPVWKSNHGLGAIGAMTAKSGNPSPLKSEAVNVLSTFARPPPCGPVPKY